MQHPLLQSGLVDARFLVGSAPKEQFDFGVIENTLRDEEHTYGDVVRDPVHDDYYVFAGKTLALFQWFDSLDAQTTVRMPATENGSLRAGDGKTETAFSQHHS